MASCPACGAPALVAWRAASASDPELAGAASFLLERCQRCGTAATVGVPTERASLYEGGTYAPPRGGLSPAIEPLRRLAERDRMRFVGGIRPGGRVLELGAGDGRFVARLARAGYEASGIDPSASAARAAAAIGAAVERAGAESAEVAEGSLDGVVIWHALEHLDDPAGVLGRVRVWLRPGGRTVVAVPNLASLQARLGGDLWFHQDVPRHRTHFTPAGLRALHERCGLRVGRVSQLLVEQNPLGMWQTLLNRLTRERDFAFRMLKRDLSPGGVGVWGRDLAVTLLAGAPLVPVAVALELTAGLAGRGGSLVLEAQA